MNAHLAHLDLSLVLLHVRSSLHNPTQPAKPSSTACYPSRSPSSKIRPPAAWLRPSHRYSRHIPKKETASSLPPTTTPSDFDRYFRDSVLFVFLHILVAGGDIVIHPTKCPYLPSTLTCTSIHTHTYTYSKRSTSPDLPLLPTRRLTVWEYLTSREQRFGRPTRTSFVRSIYIPDR